MLGMNSLSVFASVSPAALRHGIFGGGADALVDRHRRRIEHRRAFRAVASQRGAEIEEAVGIDSSGSCAVLSGSYSADLRWNIFGVAK